MGSRPGPPILCAITIHRMDRAHWGDHDRQAQDKAHGPFCLVGHYPVCFNPVWRENH